MATHRQSQVSHSADNAKGVASDAADKVVEGARSFKGFTKKFYNDWSLHLTQALTFSLVSSIVPIGILLLGIVGNAIGGLSGHARDQFIGQVMKFLPPPLSNYSTDLLQSSLQKLPETSVLLTIAGVIAAIFFGSRLFTLLEACFDFIYRVPQRSFKQKNGRAILLTLAFMILTPILVVTSLIPDQLLAFLQKTSIQTDQAVVQRIAGIISSFIVAFILFEIIYVFVPNRQGTLKNRIRSSVRGALTAAIVLEIILALFPIYAKYFSNGLVGQITFALVLLIFFYLIGLVTLIGATVNAYYSVNIPPTAHDLVTRSSRSS